MRLVGYEQVRSNTAASRRTSSLDVDHQRNLRHTGHHRDTSLPFADRLPSYLDHSDHYHPPDASRRLVSRPADPRVGNSLSRSGRLLDDTTVTPSAASSARGCSDTTSEDQSAAPGGTQHVLGSNNLIGRRSTQLTDTLEDVVHAVNVTLAQEPTIGVDRQLCTELDVPLSDEVLCLAGPAEAIGLKLVEDNRTEILVDHRHVDVV